MSKESYQTVKEFINKIKAKISEESIDKEGVNSYLSTIESEVTEIENYKNTLYQESVSRKESFKDYIKKIDKLEKELATKESEIETLKNDNTGETLKTENETLKSQLSDFHKQTKTNFTAKFEKIKGHSDFEKVKPYLSIPEEKDGKISWDDTDISVISSNLAEIEKLENLGHFGSGKNSGGGQASGNNGAGINLFDKFPDK